MIPLLSANLFRLRRDPLLWLALGVCLAGSAAFSASFRDTPSFDDVYFFPFCVALCAFLSLFLGREYGDGTLRNKVAAGFRRWEIYLAYFLTALVVDLCLLAAFLLPFALANGPALAGLAGERLALVLLGVVLLTVAMTALLTAVSCCVSHWAVGVMVNLGLWFFLMFGAYQVSFALGQPAYVTELSVDDQGNVVESDPIPNPNYLGQPLRTLAEGVEACLPHGQLNTYVSYLTHYFYVQSEGLDPAETGWEDESFLTRSPLCALAVTAGVAGVGLAVFRKKDLK